MDIQLSDIAKYAYGSGFNEGVKGGRGFLAIDDHGLLTKVYTHRGDAKKLDTLENDQFQKLRSGTDTLATRLYELAQSKGMSPAALAQVRTLLGLSEDGTARVVDGGASHTQQLLSRRVVASVISLIDPKVWEGRKDGQTIAARAAEVSTRGLVSNGQDVLREKEEISRLVGTALNHRMTDGLSAEMVKKIEHLFARELAKLRPDGSQVKSGVTVFRREAARVILPRFVAELRDLVQKDPRGDNLDLTGVNLLPVLKALPMANTQVVVEKHDEYNIVINPEKDDQGRALVGKIVDHDNPHIGDERFGQLLSHVIRQAIANGAANPKGQVFVSYEKGGLSLSLSPARKALEAEVFKLACKTVEDEKLSDGEKKRFEARLHDFMDTYTEMFIGNAKALKGFDPRTVGANLTFLARLSRDGDPRLHDSTDLLQSAFLVRLARGHERLAARLLAFCSSGDCGVANRILSNHAYVNELETTPLNRARIYRMVIGGEPTDDLDTMSHQELVSKINGDWSAHFFSIGSEPGYAAIVQGTVQGRGGMIFKDDTLAERLAKPLDGSISISMQDVLMKPIPYVIASAMKSGDAVAEENLLADVNRDHPTFKIGEQTFSYPRSESSEIKLTAEDLKPLCKAIDNLSSTPEQRRVLKNLLGQGGLEGVMAFVRRLDDSERSLAYDITKDSNETIHVKVRNLVPDNIQLKFGFEIKTTGENVMTDFSYEERQVQ